MIFCRIILYSFMFMRTLSDKKIVIDNTLEVALKNELSSFDKL